MKLFQLWQTKYPQSPTRVKVFNLSIKSKSTSKLYRYLYDSAYFLNIVSDICFRKKIEKCFTLAPAK